VFRRVKREVRAKQFFSTAEEAQFFEQVAREMADGEIYIGLKAMALAKCKGDEVTANAKYIELRVDLLKQEAALAETLVAAEQRKADQAEREVAKAEREAEKEEYTELGGPFVLLLMGGVVVALFLAPLAKVISY
jgi:hypothetical protein